MTELDIEKLKQEIQELVKDWCKKYDRTYEEALDMVSTMYIPRKNK
jgi:hypothetical protein